MSVTEPPNEAGEPPTTAAAALEAETSLLTRCDLPPSDRWLRELFAATPWSEHANYAGLAAFWQGVHRGLRSEAASLRTLLECVQARGQDPIVLERALAPLLRQYLGHLNLHHHVEDEQYFPRFRQLDSRLVAGFDLLEADHGIIHEALVHVAESGQRLISSLRGMPDVLRRDLDGHAASAERLIGLLDRHLNDEEDLVIPAILKHGEAAVS